MVQTTNPKGAAKAEVASIIPWLQVRVLPVLFADAPEARAERANHRKDQPCIEVGQQTESAYRQRTGLQGDRSLVMLKSGEWQAPCVSRSL